MDAPSTAGWDVVDTANGVHIVPTRDSVAHDLTSHDCVCGPRFEHHDKWLVVHNSLDGRELTEPASSADEAPRP